MNEQRSEAYDIDNFDGVPNASKGNKKKLSHDQRLRRRYLQKEGRRNNRYSHKGQKSGTGRKSW